MCAHKICSSTALFNNEIIKLKQIMINDGFSNAQFDKEVYKFKYRQDQQHTQAPNVNANVIKIYHKNQTSPSYNVD